MMNQQPMFDENKLLIQVFEGLWDVSMPRKWTYSEFDYEQRGIRVTGDNTMDTRSMDTWVNTQRSIAQMVKLYDEGKEFIVRDPNQAQAIFDICVNYTDFVAYKFNTSLGLAEQVKLENPEVLEVVNDVIKLQNFTNKIFPLVTTVPNVMAPTEGLLGWVHRMNNAGTIGMRRLDFNPYQRYNIDFDKYNQERNTNGEVKVVNIQNVLSTYTLSKIGDHLT